MSSIRDTTKLTVHRPVRHSGFFTTEPTEND
jgi:hypothetical protein